MKRFALAVAFFFALPVFAQQGGVSQLPGYNISIAGGYAATTGNATNNGFWSSLAVPVHQFQSAFGKEYGMNLAIRGDYFTISQPSTYVVTGGPELRFQISKPTLLNGQAFQPFINTGLGAARSQCVSTMTCPAGSDQSTHFAFKFGGGLDIPTNSALSIRIVEVDWIHSTIFPTGSVTISNAAQISTGLSIKF